MRPLRYSPTLSNAALAHSNDMNSHNFMCWYLRLFPRLRIRPPDDHFLFSTAHTGSDGSSPWDRFARAGFTNMQTGGENVASGQTSESQVMNDWMNSPVSILDLLGFGLEKGD